MIHAPKPNKFGPTVQTTRNLAYSFEDHARSRYRPEYNKTTIAETNYTINKENKFRSTEMIFR
jgi:hypothetical protein